MAVPAQHPPPWDTIPPPGTGAAPPRLSLLGPYALLNDEPVASATDDVLGARRAAVRLAALLRGSHGSTPFTLAVDGGWGTGKSSLMRLVDAELRAPAGPGAPDVHTVWYNAWTSTGGDALEGLIKSVLNGFDRSVLRRAVRRASEHRALLRTLRALAVVLGRPLGLSRMIDELWTSMSVDPQARNEMREALRAIVADWAGSADRAPGRMLVVFIDDLDRCSAETVLAVCEAVKVYLDVPGLAFVIGCDQAAIGPAGLLRDLTPAGAAFMEKIFQTSYRVPAGGPADIRGFVLHCARRAGIDILLDPDLADLVAERSARNPRRIKRLINFFLLEALLNSVWDTAEPGAVIRTMLLQYLYPGFYRMMTLPPTGPVGQDVVAEFTEYRRIRAVLRGPAAPGVALEAVRDFLDRLEVPAPPLDTPQGRAGALHEAERQLPTEFPALVADTAFTSLLDGLLATSGSGLVLRRLREGVEAPPPAPPGPPPVADPVPEPAPMPAPMPAPRPGPAAGPDPYQGRPVPYADQGSYPLYPAGSPGGRPAADRDPGSSAQAPAWPPAPQPMYEDTGGAAEADPAWDAGAAPAYSPAYSSPYPRRNVVLLASDPTARSIEYMMAGYTFPPLTRVRRVADEAAAAGLLARCDALICELDRDGEREWGFGYVRRIRADGLYAGPVVFFTSRLTPARQARAEELGAAITNDAYTLPNLVAGLIDDLTVPPRPRGAEPPPSPSS
ncbi:P-loop NTPase fold protein [Streptomyces sp. HPF1205]|uniref:KAP family P-loop NTPase fold protein n=1 Tax=Streptomyces sp. HPF1205 TaxID=2873262 RepID=UPI001CEDB2A7|nr:P-loop NTPase fold protein [Streptomyces sp. HPF1205]